MANKRMLTAILAVSFLAASCSAPGQANSGTRTSVQTQTQIIEATTVTDYFQAPGTVRAQTQTTLSSKVMGQIVSVAVREGDRVRQGDALIEIEGQESATQLRRAQAALVEAARSSDESEGAIRAAQAAVRTAEANQELTLTTRKRYDMLRERHSISPQEFDEVDSRYKAALSQTEGARESLNAAQARRLQAVARIEQAQAEVDGARVALGYLKISSPITGIVTARQAEPGVLAVPGMPLITMEDDRTYQLHAVIEESRAGSIPIGEHVSIQIDGITEEIDGRVREIVPLSDPATRTYTVKLDMLLPPQFRGRFHSGFFGRALIPAGNRQALLAPESALVQRGQLTGLYLVQNNKALLRLVKTGKRHDKGIEILSGLDPGARIISMPRPDVTDGVTVIERGGTTP